MDLTELRELAGSPLVESLKSDKRQLERLRAEAEKHKDDTTWRTSGGGQIGTMNHELLTARIAKVEENIARAEKNAEDKAIIKHEKALVKDERISKQLDALRAEAEKHKDDKMWPTSGGGQIGTMNHELLTAKIEKVEADLNRARNTVRIAYSDLPMQGDSATDDETAFDDNVSIPYDPAEFASLGPTYGDEVTKIQSLAGIGDTPQSAGDAGEESILAGDSATDLTTPKDIDTQDPGTDYDPGGSIESELEDSKAEIARLKIQAGIDAAKAEKEREKLNQLAVRTSDPVTKTGQEFNVEPTAAELAKLAGIKEKRKAHELQKERARLEYEAKQAQKKAEEVKPRVKWTSDPTDAQKHAAGRAEGLQARKAAARAAGFDSLKSARLGGHPSGNSHTWTGSGAYSEKEFRYHPSREELGLSPSIFSNPNKDPRRAREDSEGGGGDDR